MFKILQSFMDLRIIVVPYNYHAILKAALQKKFERKMLPPQCLAKLWQEQL